MYLFQYCNPVKQLKKIISFIIILIFISCDPGLVNKYVVENRTDSNMVIQTKLEYHHRRLNENDTIKRVDLPSITKSLIIEYGEIGSAYDKGIDFLNAIDTITIHMGNRTLNKDIYDRKNWSYKVLRRGLFSIDKVEYKLILKTSDFE